jgi:hypothetical protein
MTRKTFLRFATGLVLALTVSLGMTAPALAVEKIVKYQLGAGANSSVIALPANIPVMVIGNQAGDTSDFGVLQMVISNDNGGLNWTGSSTADGPKAGFSGQTGGLIMSLDEKSQVQLTIDFVLNKKGNGGTFGMVIKNLGTNTAIGRVTLFY